MSPTLAQAIDEPLFLAWLLGYDKVKHSIHEQWIRETWAPGDSTLQAHRNSYKTTCRVVAVIWGLLALPDTRVVFIRKSVDEAKATLGEIKSHYEKPNLRAVYKEAWNIDEPRNLAQWSNSRFSLVTKQQVTKERNVEAAGVGKHRTGSHYDLIIADDIVTMEDRNSHAEREATKDYVKELINILNAPDIGGIGIKYSGTPWHEDDAFSILPKAKKYPITLKFIEEMTPQEIRRRREKIADESLFQANYHLQHVSSEDRPFKNPQFGPRPEGFKQPYAYLDPAFGDTKKNNYSAITIGGMSGKEIFIDGGYIWRERIDKSYDKVVEYCYAHDVSILFVESNQAQIAMAVELSKPERGLHVRPITQLTNKHFRIMGFAKKLWGSIRFNYDLENSDYLKQILAYVDPQYSAFDDAPDSLAGLVQCLAPAARPSSVKVGSIQY